MKARVEHLNTVTPDELNLFIQKQIGLETSGFPDLLELFSKKHELKAMGEPHIGLISSENIKPKTISSDHITGIWFQGINQNLPAQTGRIAQHSHGEEGLDEIIILDRNSCYAGLPNQGGK